MLETLKFNSDCIDYVLGYDGGESNPYFLSVLKPNKNPNSKSGGIYSVYFEVVPIIEEYDNNAFFIKKPGEQPWNFCKDFKDAFVIADGLVRWDGSEYIHFVKDCELDLEQLESLTRIISKSVSKCHKILYPEG